MANFNNYNSTIGNQVIGTLNLSHNTYIHPNQEKLNALFEQIVNTAKHDKIATEQIAQTLNQLQLEINNKTPNKGNIINIISTLGSVAGIASFAQQIIELLGI